MRLHFPSEPARFNGSLRLLNLAGLGADEEQLPHPNPSPSGRGQVRAIKIGKLFIVHFLGGEGRKGLS